MKRKKEETVVRKLYSYERFSTDEQASGDSQRRQADAVAQIAAEEKLPIDTSLVVSEKKGCRAFNGRNWKRGNLARFVALVEQGVIAAGSVLAVERVSRLTRLSWEDAVGHIKHLVRLGITIRFLNPPLRITAQNLGDLEVGCPLQIFLALAHQESKEKSQMVGAVMRYKLAKSRQDGSCHGLRAPSWLEPIRQPHPNDSKRQITVGWTVIEDRKRIILRIHELVRQGVGWMKMIRILEAEGKRYWRGNGRWTLSIIRYLVRSPAVAGFRRPGFVIFERTSPAKAEPLAYPPLMSAEEQNATLFAWKSRARSSPRGCKRVLNLFTGLMESQDGQSLHLSYSTGRNGAVHAYLTNQSRSMLMRYPLLEDVILHGLRDLTAADIDGRQQQDETAAEVQRLQMQVEAKQLSLDSLIRQIDELPPDQWPERVVAKTAALEAELIELKGELRAAKERGDTSTAADSLAATQSILELLRSAGDTAEQEIMRERLKLRLPILLDRITVAEERHGRRHKWHHVKVAYRGGKVDYWSVPLGKPRAPAPAFRRDW